MERPNPGENSLSSQTLAVHIVCTPFSFPSDLFFKITHFPNIKAS